MFVRLTRVCNHCETALVSSLSSDAVQILYTRVFRCIIPKLYTNLHKYQPILNYLSTKVWLHISATPSYQLLWMPSCSMTKYACINMVMYKGGPCEMAGKIIVTHITVYMEQWKFWVTSLLPTYVNSFHSQHPVPPVFSLPPPHLVLEVRRGCQQMALQGIGRYYWSGQQRLSTCRACSTNKTVFQEAHIYIWPTERNSVMAVSFQYQTSILNKISAKNGAKQWYLQSWVFLSLIFANQLMSTNIIMAMNNIMVFWDVIQHSLVQSAKLWYRTWLRIPQDHIPNSYPHEYS